MKPLLLGTTAAVALFSLTSGALAEGGKIKLSLGGYYNGMMAFTDVDADERSYKFGSDSEIHIKGDMTLDNGMVVGFKTELELEDNSGDDVDEVFMYFKGGFGMIEFGQQDGIGDHFQAGSIRALDQLGANDSETDALGLANVTTVNETSFDYTKITYMTPAFSGLKLGISFTPEATRNKRGYTPATEDPKDEIVEFGGIYKRKIEDVDFTMSSTYVIADDSELTYDLKEWNVGARVAVKEFTFGGSYRNSEGFGNRAIGMGDHEYTAWEAGAAYETGPWQVSVQYAAHEAEDATDTTIVDGTNIFVAARYKVTNGFQIGAGVQFSDNELSGDDGSALIIETALKF